MSMGFKVGIIVGIGVGYMIATRLDPSTRNRIEAEVNKRVAQLREDPRVQDVIGTVSSLTGDAADAVGERISS